MTRTEAIGSTFVVIVFLFTFTTTWMIYPSWVWLVAISGALAEGLLALVWKLMRKYEDERIQGIEDLSMRNGFLFLSFALPLAMLVLILESVASGAVAVVVWVWLLGLLIVAISKVYYYYRK